ncbi:MAG: tRNA-dihydrouridine synthase family protein [Lachnospiraceae bacterium]|nr:tRNA-dihydrouridine synthase family protein [Lachnospiraceae bacterium]
MTAEIYFAPLEDVTGYLFRNLHNRIFPGVDRYYAPFISAVEPERKIKRRELEDTAPENNQGINMIPQILTNSSGDFINTTEMLINKGYKEINFNLGCPSRDVVKRKKGSGFLTVPDKLDRFFDEIFNTFAEKGYDDVNISVKTRIGRSDTGNLDRIIEILNRYPVSDITVHPRLGKDFYRGPLDMAAFEKMYEGLQHPVIFNGEIKSTYDIEETVKKYPKLKAIMIGRGMIRDLALAREFKDGKPLSLPEITDFTGELYRSYKERLHAEIYAVNKMKELWGWIKENPLFDGKEREIRAILKSKSAVEYESAVHMIR